MRKESGNKGFTLVELSIVIVIIGLIVAGITAGQSIIKSSKLRGLVKEVEAYKVAINQFKLVYDALPGDIKNATTFWSGTSNGNGNKKILPCAGLNYVSPNEDHLAIKHLTLADMAPQPVTNLGAAPCTAGVLDVDVPRSSTFKDKKVVFYLESDEFLWPGTTSRLASTYRAIPKHNKLYIFAGIYSGTALNGAGQLPDVYPFITLEDTISLERKFDDGYRLSGILKGSTPFSVTDSNAANPHSGASKNCNTINTATGEYYTDNISDRWCILFFDLGV